MIFIHHNILFGFSQAPVDYHRTENSGQKCGKGSSRYSPMAYIYKDCITENIETIGDYGYLHGELGITTGPVESSSCIEQSKKWIRYNCNKKVNQGIIHDFLLYTSKDKPQQILPAYQTNNH